MKQVRKKYVTANKIPYAPFSRKQIEYIKKALECKFSCAEGAVRSGKTIMHCLIFSIFLEQTTDRIHLASGSTLANAKLNIGDCNGFGLEHLFRNRCKWVKYKDNDALKVTTLRGATKYIIFSGGGKKDSYKKILGNSYGIWIATEINEHYDGDNPKESFVKVAMDRQIASINPRILWDLNPSHPQHKIYAEYIDKFLNGYVGGYNYQLFTIKDNLSISAQRFKEIASSYSTKSIWYQRNICGKRVISDGLIHQILADNPQRYFISKDQVDKNELVLITIGVDFGGNRSSHSFTAVGLKKGYRGIVFLKSKKILAKGVNVTQLTDLFIQFINDVRSDYPYIPLASRCDSAEQTIINEFYTRVARLNMPIKVQNAFKREIKTRIRGLDYMLARNLCHWVKDEAKTSYDALSSCIWANKEGHMIDERLDDGTTDIDGCDSSEYAYEEYIEKIMKASECRL